MTVCACCGSVLPDTLTMDQLQAIQFNPQERVIVSALAKAYPKKIPAARMIDNIYAGTHGGPSNAAQVVSNAVRRAREKLEPHGWTIPKGDMNGYSLQKTQPSEVWEYKTVETGRKSGTTHEEVWPEGDGWEVDPTRGRVPEGWDRFDCHEELYFRRKLA